jgi:hypothetical protein
MQQKAAVKVGFIVMRLMAAGCGVKRERAREQGDLRLGSACSCADFVLRGLFRESEFVADVGGVDGWEDGFHEVAVGVGVEVALADVVLEGVVLEGDGLAVEGALG